MSCRNLYLSCRIRWLVKIMICPRCNYVMTDFDAECPRCKLMASNGHTAPILDAPPSPPIPSPVGMANPMPASPSIPQPVPLPVATVPPPPVISSPSQTPPSPVVPQTAPVNQQPVLSTNTKRFCSNCGVRIEHTNRYCGICGNDLYADASKHVPSQTVPQSYENNQAWVPANVQYTQYRSPFSPIMKQHEKPASLDLIIGMWVATVISISLRYNLYTLSLLFDLIAFIFAIVLVCKQNNVDRINGWIKLGTKGVGFMIGFMSTFTG